MFLCNGTNMDKRKPLILNFKRQNSYVRMENIRKFNLDVTDQIVELFSVVIVCQLNSR